MFTTLRILKLFSDRPLYSPIRCSVVLTDIATKRRGTFLDESDFWSFMPWNREGACLHFGRSPYVRRGCVSYFACEVIALGEFTGHITVEMLKYINITGVCEICESFTISLSYPPPHYVSASLLCWWSLSFIFFCWAFSLCVYKCSCSSIVFGTVGCFWK